MERREYTRIATEMPAELRLPTGECFDGCLRDMSFGGAYFDCEVPLLLGEDELGRAAKEAHLVFGFEESGKRVSVDLDCYLVGAEESRVGLCWSGAKGEAYALFRDFMLRSARDPEKLQQEICRYPKSGFPRERQSPGLMDWLRHHLFHRSEHKHPVGGWHHV
jgi:hypothetical protein